MDLRRLTSFLAVAEEAHFGKAAERLFRSPASVTAHVKQLERDLGVRLLERSPVRLTPAGERFVGHARSLLAALDAAVADVTEAPPERTLRVGVMSNGSAELTPAVVQAFQRACPDVSVEFLALDFTEHVSALVQHRVDVAFVRPAPVDERIAVDVVTTERRIVVVPASWELADAPAVHLDDVLDLPYVSLPEHTPRQFSDYLYFTEARGGLTPNRSRSHAVTPHEVLTTAAAGRGAGSALESFQRYYPWPGTVCVPVLDAPPEHSVLATRAGDRNPAVRTFRSLTTRLARELGPRLRLA
ncbi:LysR family transcriptional regulator [Saccharopolyspora hordei]|uniref:DNA-binding transcriptional LysR family regulator n=1 Tax=Saccharopolyspora hordei TaxID=1838 RepID=A0A853AF97_9PSEU|nr:LysR family transcriptional regulator [Saccharopolyspora hordei]NYI83224.1 DNA-binding transcriptional LysR family regulator [Saccharopolyspora hordei]